MAFWRKPCSVSFALPGPMQGSLDFSLVLSSRPLPTLTVPPSGSEVTAVLPIAALTVAAVAESTAKH